MRMQKGEPGGSPFQSDKLRFGILESEAEIYPGSELVIAGGSVPEDCGDMRGHGDALGNRKGNTDRESVVDIVEGIPGANHSVNVQGKASQINGCARGEFDVGIIGPLVCIVGADTDGKASQLGAESDIGFKDLKPAPVPESGVIGDSDS